VVGKTLGGASVATVQGTIMLALALELLMAVALRGCRAG